MRFIRVARAEHARDECIAVHVAGPGFRQRAQQREQHGASRQRVPRIAGAQPATTRIDHQRARCEQRFDFLQAQGLLVAGVDVAGRGAIERGARFGHFGEQCGHACALRCVERAIERLARGRGAQ